MELRVIVGLHIAALGGSDEDYDIVFDRIKYLPMSEPGLVYGVIKKTVEELHPSVEPSSKPRWQR